MAKLDNLTPWDAGRSGNPSGKPKGTLNRSTILKRYLSAKLKDVPEDVPCELEGQITVEEAINLALIKKALSGDISAIREIQDTVHGKITNVAEVNHAYVRMGDVIVHEDGVMHAPLTFDVGAPVVCPVGEN